MNSFAASVTAHDSLDPFNLVLGIYSVAKKSGGSGDEEKKSLLIKSAAAAAAVLAIGLAIYKSKVLLTS